MYVDHAGYPPLLVDETVLRRIGEKCPNLTTLHLQPPLSISMWDLGPLLRGCEVLEQLSIYDYEEQLWSTEREILMLSSTNDAAIANNPRYEGLHAFEKLDHEHLGDPATVQFGQVKKLTLGGLSCSDMATRGLYQYLPNLMI